MPNNWKTYKLGEVATYVNGGAWPATSYSEKGIPVVRVTNVNNGLIDLSNCKYIDESLESKYKKHILSNNDVIICTVGSHPDQQSSVVGGVGIVNKEVVGAYLNQNAVLLRSGDSKILNQKWLGYLCKSSIFKMHIESEARGSANQVRIAISNLMSLSFKVPPLKEQQQISQILSTLDDKIELNLQQNKTLEEMAMALYKHWFVDFGPFKNGEFVDSELGKIPKGWKVSSLTDISINHNKKRKPISTREREKISGIYPYYGATKVLDYINDYQFDGEYILLAEDGTVKTKKNTPFLQFIEGKFWVSNHAHVLTGNKNYSNEFLYLCLSNENIIPIITGAVQLKINKQNLESLVFITPPMSELKTFEDVVIPLFKQKKITYKENQTLTTLRDTLLPKLISGEVRVKDIEQQIAEVL